MGRLLISHAFSLSLRHTKVIDSCLSYLSFHSTHHIQRLGIDVIKDRLSYHFFLFSEISCFSTQKSDAKLISHFCWLPPQYEKVTIPEWSEKIYTNVMFGGFICIYLMMVKDILDVFQVHDFPLFKIVQPIFPSADLHLWMCQIKHQFSPTKPRCWFWYVRNVFLSFNVLNVTRTDGCIQNFSKKETISELAGRLSLRGP